MDLGGGGFKVGSIEVVGGSSCKMENFDGVGGGGSHVGTIEVVGGGEIEVVGGGWSERINFRRVGGGDVGSSDVFQSRTFLASIIEERYSPLFPPELQNNITPW